MKTNYILIDYENVQPRSLSLLNGQPFKVLLFVGANQSKIPFELASEMQALGSDATYVRIDGNGRNALDFHIAFYTGQIAERDPDCYLHLISKDTGFDPLLKHLKSRKVRAHRLKNVADIPILKMASAKTLDAKIDAVVQNLTARGACRPRKIKTLTGTISSLFSNKLENAELSQLVEELGKRRFIATDDQNVSYLPPISQS